MGVQAEAANITSFVRALRRMGHPLREIAVLYPLHVHGDRIEEGLLRAAVPLQRASRNTIADRCAVCAPHACARRHSASGAHVSCRAVRVQCGRAGPLCVCERHGQPYQRHMPQSHLQHAATRHGRPGLEQAAHGGAQECAQDLFRRTPLR